MLSRDLQACLKKGQIVYYIYLLHIYSNTELVEVGLLILHWCRTWHKQYSCESLICLYVRHVCDKTLICIVFFSVRLCCCILLPCCNLIL